jgi:hypothetical protein
MKTLSLNSTLVENQSQTTFNLITLLGQREQKHGERKSNNSCLISHVSSLFSLQHPLAECREPTNRAAGQLSGLIDS